MHFGFLANFLSFLNFGSLLLKALKLLRIQLGFLGRTMPSSSLLFPLQQSDLKSIRKLGKLDGTAPIIVYLPSLLPIIPPNALMITGIREAKNAPFCL